MKGRRGQFLTWFGIKCSTWVAINAGTSRRAVCASMGDTSVASVAEGNKMLERTFNLKTLHSRVQSLPELPPQCNHPAGRSALLPSSQPATACGWLSNLEAP